jgi:hypothetical protein
MCVDEEDLVAWRGNDRGDMQDAAGEGLGLGLHEAPSDSVTPDYLIFGKKRFLVYLLEFQWRQFSGGYLFGAPLEIYICAYYLMLRSAYDPPYRILTITPSPH